jgi:hypothetical protein
MEMTARTAQTLVRRFRIVATLVASTAVLTALVFGVRPLLLPAVVFGLGELLETSAILAAFRMVPARCRRRVPRIRTGSRQVTREEYHERGTDRSLGRAGGVSRA